MTETVAIARPSVTKPVSRQRSAKPVLVSASVLAQHLDCSRTYIGKLKAEGVIQRHGDGFPLEHLGLNLDVGRVGFRAVGDAALETKRELVRREEVTLTACRACLYAARRVAMLPQETCGEYGSSNFPVHVDEREV